MDYLDWSAGRGADGGGGGEGREGKGREKKDKEEGVLEHALPATPCPPHHDHPSPVLPPLCPPSLPNAVGPGSSLQIILRVKVTVHKQYCVRSHKV